MKQVFVSILMVCLPATFVMADDYEQAMATAIEKLYSASDFIDYQEAASAFERIGVAEETQWLPFYYAGLGYIWSSHTTQDGPLIDGYLEKAQEFVNKAGELSPDNDEIITLQGYIYMMKVVVDPPNRGPQYSGMAMQEFGKAVGMNENNPRALMLMGRMQMGTDQFFGNDTSQSCEMIMNAAKMFESQNPKSKLEPIWGTEMANAFVSDCQSN